jgi:translocation and assembly module TamB
MQTDTREPESEGLRPKRRLLKSVLGVFAGTLLCLGAAGAWLTATESGLKTLVNWGQAPLEAALGGSVEISGVSGSLWDELTVQSFDLSIPDSGLAVSAKAFRLHWRPTKLVGGIVRIDELGASNVAVTLSPATSAPPVEEETGPFAVPRLPVQVDIRKIDFPVVSVSLDDKTTYQASVQSALESQQDGTLHAELRVAAQKDGVPADNLTGTAQIGTGSEAPFTISLTGKLPPDGLVWSLTGLEPAMRRQTDIALDVSGTVGDMSGSVSIMTRDMASLDAKITGDLASDSKRVSLQGVVDLMSGDALGLPATLNGPKELSIALQWDPDQTLAVTHFQVSQKDLLDAQGSGSLSLQTDGIDASLGVSLSSQAASILDPDLSYQSATVSAQVSGTLAEPSLTGQMTVGGLSGYGMTFGELVANLAVRGDDDGSLDYETDIKGTAGSWPNPDIQALAGSELTLRSSGNVAPDFQTIGPFELTIDPLDVEASGTLTLASDGAVDGEHLRIRLGDLAKLSGLAGIDLKGAAEVDLTGLALASDGGVSTQINIALQDLFVLDPETTGRIGPTATLAASVRRASDGAMIIALGSLRARPGLVSGDIGLSSDMETVQGTLKGEVSTQAIPPVPDLTFQSDTVPFTLAVNGPVTAPQATLKTDPIDLRYLAYSIVKSQISADLTWRETVPVVDVDTRAMVNGEPVTASLQLVAEESHLILNDVAINGLDATVTGDVTLPDYALPAIGGLNVTAKSIRQAAGFARLSGLEGAFSATLALSARKDNPTAQAARVKATLDRFGGDDDSIAAGITVRSLTLDGSVDDLVELSGLRATVTGKRIMAATVRLDQVDATFSGGVEAGEVTLSLEGKDTSDPNQAKPISVKAQTAFSIQGETTQVTLASLSGGYGGIPVSLVKPGRISLDPAGLKEVGASLALADGQADIAYTRSAADAATATVQISKLPISPFLALQGMSDVSGTLDATLKAEEVSGQVSGSGSIDLSDIKLADLEQAQGMATQITLYLKAGRLSAKLTGQGAGLEKADMSGEIPLTVSLAQPGFRMQTDSPISVEADLLADMGKVWALLPLPEHVVTGDVGVNAQIAGTMDSPRITGTASLADIAYENIEFGTIVRHVTGKVRFENRWIVVESLTGEDPAGSKFAVAGQGELAADAAQLSATVKAQNFQVIQNDSMKVWSDIDLAIKLADPDSLISGTVTVRKGEINLAAALPPSIPTLDVQEDGRVTSTDKDGTAGPAIGLDIQINLPGQVFVRGRGLDSEWQGNLKVEGTTAVPRISGLLSAKRGKFDVIGKSFTLEDSTIRFLAGDRIDPVLGIRGVYQAEDLTVIARLAGPASKPDVILESQPSLPEDEILSRVLFGKTKGRLNAAEAVQLAASVSELSGGGSGLDILGSLRRFAGVDVLEVGAGESGAQVKAGKYIADGVYVGAKQGSAPGSSSVEVEVEVTPNISVNTESGQTDSSVGVQFKWDY